MTRAFKVCLALGIGLLGGAVGCGDDEEPPPGVGSGATGGTSGTSGSGAGNAGRGGRAGGGGTAARAGEAGAGDTGGGAGAGANAAGGSSAGEGGESGGGDAGGGGSSAGRAGASGNSSGGSGGSGPIFDCPEPEPADLVTLCDPELAFGDPESVGIPAGGYDVLFAITPDELSIAWGSDEGFSGALWVADRSSASADFDTPQRLEDPALAAAQKLTLSPDRLRVGVAVGGRLLALSRANPGDTFGASAEGEYATIDADAEANGFQLGDPVIAPDDLGLYYSIVSGAAGVTLRFSARTAVSDTWPVGSAIDDCELAEDPRGMRQPTGISADGLTLFYYDSARAHARAAFRPALDAPFSLFVDLTGLGVQPNAGCDRLYYSAPTELPLGVVFAERE